MSELRNQSDDPRLDGNCGIEHHNGYARMLAVDGTIIVAVVLGDLSKQLFPILPCKVRLISQEVDHFNYPITAEGCLRCQATKRQISRQARQT